jgi:hypothetical protein
MFCAHELILGDTVGVGSRFQVLRSRTHFGRYRWASGPIFMFCAPGLIFDRAEGVGSRLHVLRSRTHFGRYRRRRVPFSCLFLLNPYRAVPRAPSPIFLFCAPGLILGCVEGVESNCHVLYSRTRFHRNRGRHVPFSYFALLESFSTVPRASCHVYMFCAPRNVLGGTKVAESRFHVLRSRTHFGRYRGRCFPF